MATSAPTISARSGTRRVSFQINTPYALESAALTALSSPSSAPRRRSQCKTCGDEDKASTEQSEATETTDEGADDPETDPETAEPSALPVLTAKSGGSALSALVVAGVIVLAAGTIVAVHFSNTPTAKRRKAARAEGLEQAILSYESSL